MPLLVFAHQGCIPDYIGEHDGSELACSSHSDGDRSNLLNECLQCKNGEYFTHNVVD